MTAAKQKGNDDWRNKPRDHGMYRFYLSGKGPSLSLRRGRP